jgi:DNA-binding MarR family transcriptional regulator
MFMEMRMTEDIVRANGYLTLGTRLKRIGERLQADSTRIADRHGQQLPSAQYPFLRALDEQGPMTIGELAQAIGITQPGATRGAGLLIKAGLAKARPGRDDQRRRIVSLTAKGRRLVDHARAHVWPEIEAAVVDLCAGLEGSLLDQLASIEDGLNKRPLDRRAGKDRRH